MAMIATDFEILRGVFRYYTRVAESADIVVAYAVEEQKISPKFCSDTGKPLA